MEHVLFVAIEVPTDAAHGLVIVAKAGKIVRIGHTSFGMADTNIDRSIRLLAAMNIQH